MASPLDINQFIHLTDALNYQVSSLPAVAGQLTPEQAFLQQFPSTVHNGMVDVTITLPPSLKVNINLPGGGTQTVNMVPASNTITSTDIDPPIQIIQNNNVFHIIFPVTSLDLANGTVSLPMSNILLDGIAARLLNVQYQANVNLLPGALVVIRLNLSSSISQSLNFLVSNALGGGTLPLADNQFNGSFDFHNATSFEDLLSKFNNEGITYPFPSFELPPRFPTPIVSVTGDFTFDQLAFADPITISSKLNFDVEESGPPGATFASFMVEFGRFLGFDFNNMSTLGDLSYLGSTVQGNATPEINNKNFVEKLFNEAFSAYLRSDFVQNMPLANTWGLPQAFFDGWRDFITNISAVAGPTPGVLGTTGFPNVNTYKDIYFSLVPGAQEEDFTKALVAFVTDPKGVVGKAGYFLPSHFLSDWVGVVENDRLSVLGLDGLADVTHSQEAAILLRVFSLLEKMLKALQNVAISQAQKEKFYANIQSEYTNLISKIPVFTVANLHATGFSDGDAGQENNRLQAVTNKNQSYTQNLQAFRDLFGDQAKQQQTAIDQSNQETTQQGNLATTILQQMSTIVQSIFGR